MSLQSHQRESWGSRLGIILAVAGSAIGLGNFLRFPVQAASNGGGAFMIPYFVSLLLLGIPLALVEWTIGRYGGSKGHGAAPAILNELCPRTKYIKYIGVLGVLGPLVIFFYYAYIESWLLGYTALAFSSGYNTAVHTGAMQNFLLGYQGIEHNQFFSSSTTAYLFFLLTFFANFWIMFAGVHKGIERLCRIAMPVLFIMGIVLIVRIFTMHSVDPTRHLSNALGFLWNPDFSQLKHIQVWFAAAGQIFFTLSIGIGAILTYSSYLKRSDDVPLSSISAVSMNEFAEVILGGSIVIPAAFIAFGPTDIVAIAKGGAFNLSFVTLPTIFGTLPFGTVFAFIWFLLLFLAGITSSVSLLQPCLAFIEDEFDIARHKAVILLGVFCFVLCHLPILFFSHGVLNELDFWAGTFALVLFGAVEAVLFSWVMGIDKGWNEMHEGATVRIPRIYKFVLKYITPTFLLVLLGAWCYQEWLPVITMHGVPAEHRMYILATRLGLIMLYLGFIFLVWYAWRRRRKIMQNA